MSACSPKGSDSKTFEVGEVYQVGDGAQSTSFGIYDTSPESPDGSRIAYVRFLEEPANPRDGRPGELWVCETDLSHHRKVCDISLVRTHNGAQVFWLDNETIGFFTPWSSEPRELLFVDADTGENRFPPIRGITSVGHEPHDGKVLYAMDVRAVGPPLGEAGIYEFDSATGKSRMVLSLAKLNTYKDLLPQEALKAKKAYREDEWKFFHLMYSPNAERIAFRIDVGENRSQRLRVNMQSDGSDFHVLNSPLLHFRFYDDSSIAGHERGVDVNREQLPVRYSSSGEYLETLAEVPGNHYAISPDRMSFASESDYNSEPVVLRYYHAGDDLSSSMVLAEFPPQDVVWEKRFHVNPSFSRDGKRVYFHMPTADGRNGTFFAVVEP